MEGLAPFLVVVGTFVHTATSLQFVFYLTGSYHTEVFTDVYLKSADGSGCDVSHCVSKARMAPVKFLTISRLELQGAVVGLRLAKSTSKDLNLSLSGVTFWTDSTTVLQWIPSRKGRFQTLVASRIGEILDSTASSQWRHVPGQLNPADFCSRRLSGEDLSGDYPWF